MTPESQLTEAEVASVKQYHAEQIKKKCLTKASYWANLMVNGGITYYKGGIRSGIIAWCPKTVPGISNSLKLTKTQKEALKTHIASWLNKSDWFKPE